jgi:hypothetical protein
MNLHLRPKFLLNRWENNKTHMSQTIHSVSHDSLLQFKKVCTGQLSYVHSLLIKYFINHQDMGNNILHKKCVLHFLQQLLIHFLL